MHSIGCRKLTTAEEGLNPVGCGIVRASFSHRPPLGLSESRGGR
jgi:hypothetical protein